MKGQKQLSFLNVKIASIISSNDAIKTPALPVGP